MTKTPRPHAETIKLWADGANIQYRAPRSDAWVDCPHPAWESDYEYRVKPARSYPTTAAHAERLDAIYEELTHRSHRGRLVELANFALRHAIDNGQVVTREEFAKVSEEAQCATKSLIAAGYTYRGGELWQPPITDRAKRDMEVAQAVIRACAYAIPPGQGAAYIAREMTTAKLLEVIAMVGK